MYNNFSLQSGVISLLVCSNVDSGAELPQAHEHCDDHNHSKVC